VHPRGTLIALSHLRGASAFLSAPFSPELITDVHRLLRLKVALRRENVRAWHEVEHDFMSSEYRAVRERQMKELEDEDDLSSRMPVRCAQYSVSLLVK
jgi:hypothetical protein